MWPRPRRSLPGRASFVPVRQPRTLTSKTRRATSSGSSIIGPMGMIPALLTSTSSGPTSRSMSARNAAKESRSVTSRPEARTSVPSRSAAAVTALPSTSPIATRAPAARRARAVDSPIPRPPPVTATTRPFTSLTLPMLISLARGTECPYSMSTHEVCLSRRLDTVPGHDGMRLVMMLPASPAPFAEVAARVADLERAGLDAVLVPEAYSFDAVSQVGYLAARTERLEIGTGIVNVYSRSATLLGQTAAGCDYVSGGRFLLGLGVSGPQVIEGFHGIPYERPRSRTLDCIEVVRKVVAREVLVHEGPTVEVPLRDGRGTGLGKPLKLINRPVRPAVPIWWAAMLGKAVESAAEVADGWMPLMFVPEAADDVWGAALAAGRARRSR